MVPKKILRLFYKEENLLKIRQKIGAVISLMVLGISLVGCGQKTGNHSKKANISAALVTDSGGVDDKSFNQNGWEGLEDWGQKNHLKKGIGGYNYAQSNSDADFTSNINKLIQAKYQTIIGIGYKLQTAITNAAKNNPNTNFVLIDAVAPGKNVASVTYRDNEGAFLAGIAAAKTTKTKRVGFIGGIRSEVMDRIEAGYRQGVAAIDKSIQVDVKYAESFSKPDVGQALAQAMFNNQVDVIFQGSGGTGNGVFAAAKNVIKHQKVWVIGSDRDQEAEGKYGNKSLTLTSCTKGVKKSVYNLAAAAQKGKFPGGKTTSYGLKEGGMDLIRGNLNEDTWKVVQDYRNKIIVGDLKVAKKVSQSK